MTPESFTICGFYLHIGSWLWQKKEVLIQEGLGFYFIRRELLLPTPLALFTNPPIVKLFQVKITHRELPNSVFFFTLLPSPLILPKSLGWVLTKVCHRFVCWKFISQFILNHVQGIIAHVLLLFNSMHSHPQSLFYIHLSFPGISMYYFYAELYSSIALLSEKGVNIHFICTASHRIAYSLSQTFMLSDNSILPI